VLAAVTGSLAPAEPLENRELLLVQPGRAYPGDDDEGGDARVQPGAGSPAGVWLTASVADRQ
jgi:hypothetical protein